MQKQIKLDIAKEKKQEAAFSKKINLSLLLKFPTILSVSNLFRKILPLNGHHILILTFLHLSSLSPPLSLSLSLQFIKIETLS